MPNGQKWIVGNGWALGHSGNRSVFNLLDNEFHKLLVDIDPSVWEVSRALKHLFESHGIQKDSEPGPPSYDQNMIWATPHGVWDIDRCLGYTKMPEGELWAEGSGRSFALGVGHAT